MKVLDVYNIFQPPYWPILVHIRCAPTWRPHTQVSQEPTTLGELCKFLRNISTNICSLGKRTDLKLGEVSSLFISYKITISWLYPLNGFRFILYCMTVKPIYSGTRQPRSQGGEREDRPWERGWGRGWIPLYHLHPATSPQGALTSG